MAENYTDTDVYIYSNQRAWSATEKVGREILIDQCIVSFVRFFTLSFLLSLFGLLCSIDPHSVTYLPPNTTPGRPAAPTTPDTQLAALRFHTAPFNISITVSDIKATVCEYN